MNKAETNGPEISELLASFGGATETRSLGQCVMLSSLPPRMITFRKLSGDTLSLSYTSLFWVAQLGGILEFGFNTHRVKLNGRHLKNIHDAALRHEVAEVQQVERPSTDAKDDSLPVVWGIEDAENR